ncbi:unnamed protein product [Rotaria magnacalcarata]|uniref:Uncharacterized protein n=1 Tax=Rotaria magnacalcarata TaxID=392030 RepID=A0A816NW31_9BILA|nr:unnamed protein product [Rotaria magnacalcarata]
MTQNTIEPVNFTGESFQSANAPVWTVSSNPTSTSNSNLFKAKNDKNSQNYNTDRTSSAPDIGDFQHNYFDISKAPKSAVIHYNEVVPFSEVSRAEIKRKSDGVLSVDPLIDDNPDQLWLYFMTYLNEKPYLGVNIHGYHVQHYTTYERRRSTGGHYRTRTVQRTHNVTDFHLTIDLTSYVSRQWLRIAVIPSKNTMKAGEVVSLRHAIEQYTRSEKNLKEIVCQKQFVGWNFQELKNKIKGLISSTGYPHHIGVTFFANNNRISARSPSKMSRFANSTVVRLLCVISCLFLIIGPIYLCFRAAHSMYHRIVVDYSMVAPIDTFLSFNRAVITNAARDRSSHSYVANLA